ncbi:MAG: hypothetical protein U9Q98_05120 [Bacteroidota bacterium]|nr:hypothetical protein [Bacteroidota bacterium]
MKVLTILIIGLFLSPSIFAQDSESVDPRLNVRFSETQIQQWEQNYPNRLDLYEFELEHGYDIQLMPEEKIQDMPFLYYLDYETKSKGEKVQFVDEQNFNLYLYNYKRDMKHNNHYRIAGTNKVLVIYANKKFVDMFNESRSYE